MKRKSILSLMILLLMIFISNIVIITYKPKVDGENIRLDFAMESEDAGVLKVYYLFEGQRPEYDFSEQQCVSVEYTQVGKEEVLSVELPALVTFVRIDPFENGAEATIGNPVVSYEENVIDVANFQERVYMLHDMSALGKGSYLAEEDTEDPYVVWSVPTDEIADELRDKLLPGQIMINVLICVVLDIFFIFVYCKRRSFFEIPKEIMNNRKLIFSLSKNDFKSKFAGSYFGIVWAFVQPLVTILVYWFVFDKALNSGTQITKSGIEAPFVIWLTAGMVPWFYFSEVLNTGSNALVEYNYLVKKVVFKISVLPIVKVISSLFVHVFFVVFMIILCACYQFYPSLYTLQIIYYSFAMICLCVSIIYITSALTVFFRDLTQVINIVLQILMWMTPIMWNIDAMEARISPILVFVLKMNPMYYIVEGYRDAMINHAWFWERPEITLYFWGLTALLFVVGSTVFRKLRVHFADVL